MSGLYLPGKEPDEPEQPLIVKDRIWKVDR